MFFSDFVFWVLPECCGLCSGVWGIGVATQKVNLNQVPMGRDTNSLVLRHDGSVYHNNEEKNRLPANSLPQEGDIVVSATFFTLHLCMSHNRYKGNRFKPLNQDSLMKSTTTGFSLPHLRTLINDWKLTFVNPFISYSKVHRENQWFYLQWTNELLIRCCLLAEFGSITSIQEMLFKHWSKKHNTFELINDGCGE